MDSGESCSRSELESQLLFNELLTAAGIGFYRLSVDGTILHIDRRTLEILGADERHPVPEALVGTSLRELIRFEEPKPKFLESMKGDERLSGREVVWHSVSNRPRWSLHDYLVSFDEERGAQVVHGMVRDITSIELSDVANGNDMDLYRAVFDGSRDGVLFYDAETGSVLQANSTACEMWGYPLETLRNMKVDELCADSSICAFSKDFERLASEAESHDRQCEVMGKRSDNSRFSMQASFHLMKVGGRPIIVATVRDISERREMQQALERTERQFRTLVDTMNEGVGIADIDGKLTYVNAAYAHMLGYEREDLLDHLLTDLLDKENRRIFEAQLILRAAGRAATYDLDITTKQGVLINTIVSANPIFGPNGEVVGSFATITDITQRKQEEEALHLEHRTMLSIMDSIDEAIYVSDTDTCEIVYANEALLKRHGPLVGRICYKALRGLEVPCAECALESLLEEEQDVVVREWHNQANGRWYRSICKTIPWSDGRLALLIMDIDLTERVKAEIALRESEADLNATLDSIGEAVVVTNRDGHIVRMNPSAEALSEWTLREVNGWHLDEVLRFLNAENREPIEGYLNLVVNKDPALRRLEEHLLITREGRVRRIADSVSPIVNENGVRGYVLVLRDVTEQRWMEEQLLLSRKLESLGRLAGGISHDFNNLLGAIRGYCDIMLQDLPTGDPIRQDVEAIDTAVQLASQLTGQLMAFSRRQVSRVQPININTVVTDMQKMLARLIGEDVELVVHTTPDINLIKADRGHIEQVIMNLAVNARDAMPTGGKLTIETANVRLPENVEESGLASGHTGPYVKLLVSDTGLGMSDEIRSLIFEPFFTTKEPGEGTGLGLSTVYGIVRQCGGIVVVDSESGKGSVFDIYFPGIDVDQADVRTSTPGPSVGSETILVVEDQDLLRKLITRTLRRSGYHVFEASQGGEALLLCEKHQGRIDLLLTDVVMPNISGVELAKRVSAKHPNIEILFMTGYEDDALEPHGLPFEEVQLMRKPFSVIDLAKRVRAILDERPSRSG